MPSALDAQPVVAGSANCLVVDDEPGVRRSLARMLQAQGFQCFEAGTGLEALDNPQDVGKSVEFTVTVTSAGEVVNVGQVSLTVDGVVLATSLGSWPVT